MHLRGSQNQNRRHWYNWQPTRRCTDLQARPLRYAWQVKPPRRVQVRNTTSRKPVSSCTCTHTSSNSFEHLILLIFRLKSICSNGDNQLLVTREGYNPEHVWPEVQANPKEAYGSVSLKVLTPPAISRLPEPKVTQNFTTKISKNYSGTIRRTITKTMLFRVR